jgi:hypothetical protein
MKTERKVVGVFCAGLGETEKTVCCLPEGEFGGPVRWATT